MYRDDPEALGGTKEGLERSEEVAPYRSLQRTRGRELPLESTRCYKGRSGELVQVAQVTGGLVNGRHTGSQYIRALGRLLELFAGS